jgi:hypothetical protein
VYFKKALDEESGLSLEAKQCVMIGRRLTATMVESDSGAFIEFMLYAIRDTLKELAATEQVTVQVTDQVERLLAVLGAHELSLKELMGKLELKHRPSFRQSYLIPALDLGLVEMTIPDKPNSSKQKYRIKR